MSRRALTALSLRMAALAMALTGIGLALPRLQADLGFTLPQQGLLVSIQYVGFTVAVLAGGALSDRFGLARTVRFGLLGLAVAAALFGATWAYPAAAAAALLIGMSGSVVENAATAIAMEDPKTRDRNNLVAQSVFSVGAIAMPLLYLLSDKLFGAWRPPYFIAAVLALAFFAFPGKLKDERQAARTKLSDAFRQYAGFLRRPACLIAPAAMFLYVGAEVGLWAFAPVYFENSGYGMLAAAVSSALIWFMLLLGRFATAGLVGKVGIVRTMLAFSVVAVAAFVMLLLSSGVWAVVWMAVAGFSCGPFFPLIISWMMRLTGEKGGPAIAFTMACGTLGSVLLSGVTGFLAGRLGAQFVMLLPLVCFAGIFILLIRFGKKEQNTPE